MTRANKTSILKGRLFVATMLAGLSTGFAMEAHAQAATSIEEVVVTSRKQSENLQTAPVTVTAFSAKAIDHLQVKDVFALATVTPGLYFGTTGGRNGGNKLQIRNLSTGTSGGSKASAFIDGVFMSGDYASTPFANLERIEVLKGPQSAAYGRSTFVGAVNFITKDPTTKPSGKLEGSFASEDDTDVNGYISGPIFSDKLTSTLTGRVYNFTGPDEWKNRDGYHLGDQSTRSISSKTVWRPIDDLKLTLYASYVHDRDHIPATLFNNLDQRNLTVTRPDGTLGYYYKGAVTTNYAFPNWNEAIVGYLDNPGVDRNQNRFAVFYDYKVLNQNITGFYSQTHENLKNNFDFNYEGFGTVVAPNARGVPTTYSYNATNYYQRTITDDKQFEIRMSAPATWRLRYTIGYNYTDLSGDAVLISHNVTSTGALVPVGTFPSHSNNWVGGNPARDNSVFGGLYFDITDKLNVSAEVRRQSERVQSTNFITNLSYSATFKSTLPRINIQYKFSPKFQMYAVYSEGNNPGGFNSAVAPAFVAVAGVPVAYGEEKLRNYEAGFKSLWLDGRLLFNVAAYHMDWINEQVLQSYVTGATGPGTVSAFTTSTASTKVNGFEAEVEAIPIQGLTLHGTVGYGKSKYNDYCSSNYAVLTGIQDRLGCRLVNGKQQEGTPALQVSVSEDYTRPINDVWNMFVRSDYSYLSKVYLDEFNYAWIKPQQIVNARVGVSNDRYTVELFGRNLLDDDTGPRVTRVTDARVGVGGGYPAINGVGQGAAGQQNVAATPRKPRQFGVRLAVQF